MSESRRQEVQLRCVGGELWGIFAAKAGKSARDQKVNASWCSPRLAQWAARASDDDKVGAVFVMTIVNGNVRKQMLKGDEQPAPPTTSASAAAASLAPDVAEQPNDARVRHERLEHDGGFRNPYTFVPALPRLDMPPGLGDAGPDGPPGHDRYRDGQWAGTLTVHLTTQTPLLLPDTAAAERDDDHMTYATRVDRDGQPFIHGASLKGALRAAYEAITVSRYGIFRGHELPRAYRRRPGQARDLVPGRIEDGPHGPVIRLCEGDEAWSAHDQSQGGSDGALRAAWVPWHTQASCRVRRVGRLAGRAVEDLHEQPVAARVRLMRQPQGKNRYLAWVATHLAATIDELKAHTGPTAHDPEPVGKKREFVANQQPRLVNGWLSVTGRSIGNKKFERLFVKTDHDEQIELTPELRQSWTVILAAYADAIATGSSQPRQGTVRSRYIDEHTRGGTIADLPAGTLVHVEFRDETAHHGQTRRTPVALHPVMIGRQPYDAAPADLLHPSLAPARSADELSPADRVFGWVPPETTPTDPTRRSVGYRGRLAIGRATCERADWRQAHGNNGVDLAPLSSPKPTQFRFYASPSHDAAPMPRGVAKAHGYRNGAGLRGRKFYWWPKADDGYWEPSQPRPSGQPRREYLLPANARHGDDAIKPSQYATHRDWVRPETTFTVDLHIDGISEADLAPLIWLLTRPEDQALRLGAGKPLGFGAVHAHLHAARLWRGEQLREGWLDFERPAPVPEDEIRQLGTDFEALASEHSVLGPALRAMTAIATATPDTVHYPRRTPTPTTKSYEWFTRNEAEQNHGLNNGFALPPADDADPRLPYLPHGGPGGQ